MKVYQHEERDEISLSLLDEDPLNPRVYTDEDVAERILSIETFGQPRDILVRQVGPRFTIIGGHRTARAMRQMGRQTAWCKVMTEWGETTAQAFMLVDNGKVPDDERKLLITISKLQQEGMDLAVVGIDEDDLEHLRRRLDASANGERVSKQGGGVRQKPEARALTLVLYIEQADVVESAMRKTGILNRGEAIKAVCQAFIDGDTMLPTSFGGGVE